MTKSFFTEKNFGGSDREKARKVELYRLIYDFRERGWSWVDAEFLARRKVER